MITITVENRTQVTLSVTELHTGTTFPFRFDAGTEWAAALLAYELRHDLWNALVGIRREAYQAGWKDAKAHAVKETWFTGVLKP